MISEPPITADEVTAEHIPRHRSGLRFEVAEVDRFLADCRTAIRARENGRRTTMTADAVLLAEFQTVKRFAVGYAADPLDILLDRVVLKLRQLEE